MTPFKIVILFIFFSLIGVLLVPRLSIDLNPSSRLPKLTVTYSLPGGSPEIMEQQATAPLENGLSQIPNVKKIYSVSSQNQGNIEVTFDKNADLGFKKFEVSSLIRRLYPKLHPQLSYPIVEQRGREDDSKNALLVYQINSKLAPFQIKKLAKEIFVPSLSQLSGVRDVLVDGATDLQITVNYDYQKMQLYGISENGISKTIREEFSSAYPGSMSTQSGQKFLIKAEHAFQNISEIENLLLPAMEQNIRLKDVANVFIEESKPRQYFRINGLNSITLAIYADEGVNRLELASILQASVIGSSAKLPDGYQIRLDYNDTDFISKEIRKNYFRAGVSVLILIAFIFIAYRNWYYLFVLFTGIIINLCLTALAAYYLKISIHLYTIAGITIAFGMLMDNAIMMLDHIHNRHNSIIFRAILGASLTTVMALLLVLLLPEEERHDLTEFSIIVAVALSCSILVATFYIPAAYSLIIQKNQRERKRLTIRSLRMKTLLFIRYSQSISFISRYRKIFIAFLILAFGLPVFMLPVKLQGQDWYNKTIGSDFYQEKIRPFSDKILGGSIRLFARNVFERSGYRNPGRTTLYINAELPHGNTIDEMNKVMLDMEDYLRTITGIERYITQVRSGQNASIVVLFNEKYEKSSLPYQLKARIIARSLDWNGVEWDIFGVGRGFSNSGNDELPSFRVQMKGYNYDELEQYANKLAGKLLLHKRIKKVNTNERLSWQEKITQQYILDFDHEKASMIGVSPALVADFLHEKADKEGPQLFLQLQDSYLPVYIKSRSGSKLSAYDVLEGSVTINSRSSKLSSLANIHLNKTTNSIHKEQRQYIRVIGFDYYGSSVFGGKYLDQALEEINQEMPNGYSAERITSYWDWQKTKRQYSLILILLVGVYFIGAILFESLRQPIYIITSVPVSFIGLFLVFSVFNFYFDQGGYAAFILLGGLVVNSSVFILNDFNSLKSGNRNRAMLKAVVGKLRPITLSILSTCFGLIPFVLNGQSEIFWFALAVGTMGGLLFSLFSILILVPVLSHD